MLYQFVVKDSVEQELNEKKSKCLLPIICKELWKAFKDLKCMSADMEKILLLVAKQYMKGNNSYFINKLISKYPQYIAEMVKIYPPVY